MECKMPDGDSKASRKGVEKRKEAKKKQGKYKVVELIHNALVITINVSRVNMQVKIRIFSSLDK